MIDLIVAIIIGNALSKGNSAEDDRKDRERTLLRNLRRDKAREAKETQQQEKEARRYREQQEGMKKTHVWDQQANCWREIRTHVWDEKAKCKREIQDASDQYWHGTYQKYVPLNETCLWDEETQCWWVQTDALILQAYDVEWRLQEARRIAHSWRAHTQTLEEYEDKCRMVANAWRVPYDAL